MMVFTSDGSAHGNSVWGLLAMLLVFRSSARGPSGLMVKASIQNMLDLFSVDLFYFSLNNNNKKTPHHYGR